MGVNRVDTASGEVIMDISDSTVTPETLAEGEKAYNSKGERIVGTMPQGGGDCNFVVEVAFNLTDMSISKVSHTYDEIISALQDGKQVLFKSDYGLGFGYGQLAAHVLYPSEILMFQQMIQNDFGDGVKLYYFNVKYYPDNSAVVKTYIVNTTAMGG